MTAAPSYTAAPRPLGRLQVEDEAERLAGALMAALLPPGGPRRLALMNGPHKDRKYSDAPAGHAFGLGDMLDHLRGARTWALSLLDRAGLAVAGCRDYDDSARGRRLALSALARARRRGLVAFCIILDGRAHVWMLYRRPVRGADIAAQLAEVCRPGAGEIYPSGNAIRLPIGLHRHKDTRGELVLQDGRRFALDSGAERTAAVRALVALRRNAPPPPAPTHARRRADNAQLSVAFDAANWEGVTAEQGAALMASARYKALFTNRPQLARLARGQRIVITTDAGADDTGSQQLAALVANLLTTGRSLDGKGAIVPGLGAPPLAEIRAVALHWRDTLRDGYALDSYRADVDRLIVKYTPAGYAPEATRSTAQQPAPAPVELAEARHRGRPAGDLARALDALAAELAPGAIVTRGGLGLALGCTPRTITSHLRALASAGRVELEATARGYRVLRVENKSAALPKAAPAHQDAPGTAEGGNKPGAAEGGKLAPFAASECDAATGVHTAPPAPPCPAPAAAGDAAALDLEALAARIDEAAGTIRAQVSTRIIRRGPRAGLVVETRPRATLAAVAAALSDVPPDALAEAWAYRRSWRRDADRLAAQQNPGELYKELRNTRDALRLAEKSAPLPWAELGDDERARLAARKLGRAEGDDRRAAALAEAQQREHIRRHRSAVQRRRHNERLERQIAQELRRRGLPLEAPTSRASVGKRAKAPSRDDVRRAEAEQQAECLEALDRLYSRARAQAAGDAPRRPRVELPRAAKSTRESTAAGDGFAALLLDAPRMAAAGRSLAERARAGSLLLPAQEASFAD